MGCLGNLLWLIFGGFFAGLSWLVIGLLWCVTVVGIPVGLQCFKFAKLSFCPFGKEVEYDAGPVRLLLNILWLFFGGIELALEFAALGVLLYITVIGIPFGHQMFKLAKLALMPLGAKVR